MSWSSRPRSIQTWDPPLAHAQQFSKALFRQKDSKSSRFTLTRVSRNSHCFQVILSVGIPQGHRSKECSACPAKRDWGSFARALARGMDIRRWRSVIGTSLCFALLRITWISKPCKFRSGRKTASICCFLYFHTQCHWSGSLPWRTWTTLPCHRNFCLIKFACGTRKKSKTTYQKWWNIIRQKNTLNKSP